VKKLVLLLLVQIPLVGGASAQLISPGKLSTVHERLEGISQCVTCHQLGVRGVSATLCLNCHEPLAARIERELGYHGQMESLACGSCHKEHFGREFDVLRFDSLAFNHQDSGYELLGSHIEAQCSDCHTSGLITDPGVIAFKGDAGALDHTFLGLETTCVGCHESESPHGLQFEDQTCTNCHTEEVWESAELFDHAAARYTLTGKHLSVECAQCHSSEGSIDMPEVLYRPIPFGGCLDCHEDEHQGRFEAACASCHRTAGWSSVSESTLASNFDHDRTGFALSGAHVEATCASCHDAGAPTSPTVRMRFVSTRGRANYRQPVGTECADCHLDAHDSSFSMQPDPMACADCHDAGAWTPSSFGLDEHQQGARFELEGAHLAVPCSACHSTVEEEIAPHFLVEDRSCQSCHEPDDPHGEQFASAAGASLCGSCHGTEDWSLASFDHDGTDFPLLGAHILTTCQGCHEPQQSGPTTYRSLEMSCEGCHAADDPHVDQFEDRTCDSCHDSEAFRLTAFEHQNTRFPLDGAHKKVACASCHGTEPSPSGLPFVRFRPLELTCISCHGS